MIGGSLVAWRLAWVWGLAAAASDQRGALVALYNATDGPNWANGARWVTAGDPCAWFGVTCDAAGAVTGLALGSNGLAGTLGDVGPLAPTLAHLDLSRASRVLPRREKGKRERSQSVGTTND